MNDCPAPLPFDRFRADLVDTAFSPHRHDTYTFALTVRGVQAFDYRGETRHSLPGAAVVLHPDELHDGRPVTEGGFGYAALTVLPEHFASRIPSRGLPFLAGGVSRDRRLTSAIGAAFRLPPSGEDGLAAETVLIELAQALEAVSDAPPPARTPRTDAVERARLHLHERMTEQVTLEELEALTGLGRWQLCRDFRAVLGTSPYRYLTLRRLDRVKAALRSGRPSAGAALEAGFSDQAHMSRQFRAAFGMTPRCWMALAAPSGRTILQDATERTGDTRPH